jgi:peptidoglycan/xylan/chitin deacetylase (PgdA/CDA1 family)
MMLAFLYHRVGGGKYANPPEQFERHLACLAKRSKNVLPGEPLSPLSLNVCLTFDDATYDFYHYAYPLLKKYGLRALLAVPVYYILEETEIDPEIRLSIPYSAAMKGDTFQTHAPFCTWVEIREMVLSGCVTIASHSVHHQHLLTQGLDLDLEIEGSKRILEEKLQISVSTFVYPLGKFNRAIHKRVKKHYEFAVRIGTAWNWSWQNSSGMIYRVLSDNLKEIDQHLRFRRWLSFSWFHLVNSLRRR